MHAKVAIDENMLLLTHFNVIIIIIIFYKRVVAMIVFINMQFQYTQNLFFNKIKRKLI